MLFRTWPFAKSDLDKQPFQPKHRREENIEGYLCNRVAPIN